MSDTAAKPAETKAEPDKPAAPAPDPPVEPPTTTETPEPPKPEPVPELPPSTDTPPPAPAPEPQPEPKPDPPAEPSAPPAPALQPEPDKPAPDPEPKVAPKESTDTEPPKPEDKPETKPDQPTPKQPDPAPELARPAVPGVPPAVLALTDDELRAAAAYFLQKHQRNLSSKGVAARQAREKQRMDIAEKFIAKHSSTKVASVAYEINCSPKTTASYLRKLVIQGRITATGHGVTRRYHAK